MSAPVNQFKAILKTGPAQIGLWVAMANAYTTEMCAGMGFDWLLIDGEHAPNDVRSILQQLQAVAPYPVHPVVRLPIGETYLIKQYLDIGAQTLLIPLVETGQQAQELVAAVRYPTRGVRGVGASLSRAARWGAHSDYLATASDEICLLVQVETRRGLDNLDAIAAVPGVDGVFIGPSDLSAALGYLGNPGVQEVQSLIENGVKRIQAAGKAPGILVMDEPVARRYISLGCKFVAVGTDIALLTKAGRALAQQFKTRS